MLYSTVLILIYLLIGYKRGHLLLRDIIYTASMFEMIIIILIYTHLYWVRDFSSWIKLLPSKHKFLFQVSRSMFNILLFIFLLFLLNWRNFVFIFASGGFNRLSIIFLFGTRWRPGNESNRAVVVDWVVLVSFSRVFFRFLFGNIIFGSIRKRFPQMNWWWGEWRLARGRSPSFKSQKHPKCGFDPCKYYRLVRKLINFTN